MVAKITDITTRSELKLLRGVEIADRLQNCRLMQKLQTDAEIVASCKSCRQMENVQTNAKMQKLQMNSKILDRYLNGRQMLNCRHMLEVRADAKISDR
jgi:transcription elongation factor Elf1